MSAQILLFLRIALAASLYVFLGMALWLLWRDLRGQRALLALGEAPALILVLREDGAQEFRFTIPEVILGRDPLCDCYVPDATISARHARLSYHHGQWWVEDLGSRNGTHLNEAPVEEASVVTSGDRLRCGQVSLDISIAETDTQFIAHSLRHNSIQGDITDE